jgi:hypothetical protein
MDVQLEKEYSESLKLLHNSKIEINHSSVILQSQKDFSNIATNVDKISHSYDDRFWCTLL